MNNAELAYIIRRAVDGDTEAIEVILKRYMPLIENCSYSDGVMDVDCKQHIMIRIVAQLHKFGETDSQGADAPFNEGISSAP